DVGDRAQMAGRVDDDRPTRTHGVKVDAADVRADPGNMGEALLRPHEGRTGTELTGIVLADFDPATRPAGQIDQHFVVLIADPADDFLVQAEIRTDLSRYRIAHMDVHDRRARRRRLNRGMCDFFRGYR